MKLDIIGDVHGHLHALRHLGDELGYDTRDGWGHPDGRLLVFLGDLVDRGPHSLEVAELVMELVATRRALCLMGNHEYNLVRWHHGQTAPKPSNRDTILDVAGRAGRWSAAIAWFETLPLALELPALRAVHAVWRLDCVASVAAALGPREVAAVPSDRYGALTAAVAVPSPFTSGRLQPALSHLPASTGEEPPHEVLIKGYDVVAPEPYLDRDGHRRTMTRAAWWDEPGAHVKRDGLTVFGHYWNAPPYGIHTRATPPRLEPSREADWRCALGDVVPPRGRVALPPAVPFVCVDYNGLSSAGVGCVGAYRWPEHEVVWARAAAP